MGFTLLASEIKEGKTGISYFENEHSGTVKVAGYVSEDMEKVFGQKPLAQAGKMYEKTVLFASLDVSLDKLELREDIDMTKVNSIKGKRECYTFILSQDGKTLYIIGSDKRGTIYGLFHLSELMGVSAQVDWLMVNPLKKEEIIIDDSRLITSKEPSVRYRGFFINDEWPAFGNWVTHHFGDFNAKAYEHIFKVLLRMKGNYLWPAMWSGRFPVDGPGLLSAELADELGVVMGMSHHEPCLRQGEEYKYLRGKDSIYGDAWDFRSNKEGITKFWEDGLIRSGKFENVITVGMRGEADSTILGKNATLKDNIDLLRDVLVTQNRLIKQYVNEDLDKVPRMLALYKEVEPFFYGDEDTEGLIGSKELEGVTLMLCDDNHGNLRTLPDDSMRNHKGGYGMYYHFDYHGLPISYEWVNSSSLHKTWEQMTNAYEFGIRNLWIVNVGDVFTNEFPLSYFLDLAYDYDKWGVSNIASPSEYASLFVEKNFAYYDEKTREDILYMLEEYTRIGHIRRPEHMNDNVYAPMAYREREELYAQIEKLLSMAEDIYTNNYSWPFHEIVYYPLVGNLNNQKLWLDTTYNHYLASIRASQTDSIGDKVYEGLENDVKLVDTIHKAENGRWYGMGLSEHIGFDRWNEEECRYPVVYSMKPSNKDRIVAVVPENGSATEGGVWTKKKLILPDFARYNSDTAEIYLYSTSDKDAPFTITTDSECVSVDKSSGTVPAKGLEVVTVSLDKSKISSCEVNPVIRITKELMDASIEVLLPRTAEAKETNTYIFSDSYVSIEADGYCELESGKNDDGEDAAFSLIPDFGKTKCGLKIFPVTSSFVDSSTRPSVSYAFNTKKSGEYRVRLYLAPTNPIYRDNKLELLASCNGAPDMTLDVFDKDYKIADGNAVWEKGALDNIHIFEFDIDCVSGDNKLTIKPLSPGLVIEKLCIYENGMVPQDSYLGPKETYKINSRS